MSGPTSGGRLLKGHGDVVEADDGILIDPSSLAQTLSYSSGVLQYIEVTAGADTYRQTYTYSGADLTGVSQWEKQ